MCEMKENFKGLTMIFVNDAHNFDQESVLRCEKESVASKNGFDIRGIFVTWKKEGKMLSSEEGKEQL